MNFGIKKTGFKTLSTPFSLSSVIKKNQIKNLSHKMFKNISGINKKEEDIYNFELEQSSENRDLTIKNPKKKIKFENILKNYKNSSVKENYLLNQLIQLKMENNKFKKSINEKKYINIDIDENENDEELFELITEYTNLLSENKKIKKSMILQQILINEMKKDMENLNSEKNINKNKYLENNEDRNNGDNNYKNILKEKNDLINELKNKNTKLTNENQNLKIKINQILPINEKNNFIDNLYENIIKILKELENDNKKNDNFFDNELLKHINDDNGNYSIIDKKNIINKFIEFAKSEFKNLFKFYKKKKEDKIKIYNYDHNFEDSGNGINNNDSKEKLSGKKDIFFNYSNFKLNDRLENSLLTKSNNRYIFSNFDSSLNENSNNSNNEFNSMLDKNKDRSYLKKKFLDKNGIIFKSNLVSNSKNSLDSSKDNSNIDLNLRIKEFKETINKKDYNISYKNNKKIKIPTPKVQINKTLNYITPDKIYEKNIKQLETAPFKIKLNKTIKSKITKKQLNYSACDKNNKKEKENNEKPNLEHIKTDLNVNNKYGLEYIKLDLIFQNLNNSSILSSQKKTKENSIKNLKSKKIEKNYKNKDTKINNNGIPKFLKMKNIKEVNGLTKEVMKQSFLKTDISQSINNNNKEKDTDNFIFKDIKKYEILKNQNIH